MDANSKDELIKKSIRTIRELRRELEHRASVDVPVAVVGMACRFPGGANSPEQFWELLQAGGSGLVDVPPERWNVDAFYSPPPGKPGRSYIRRSNFLSGDVAEFDARFFGISPVEANAMDPQQRVLLEVCWEALEHAHLAPNKLRGQSVGVYVGSTNNDYGMIITADPAEAHPYALTGTSSAVIPNRISYAFDFRGPSVSVDTACSSSLVALHQAVRDLRAGDADVAVAGGVNILASPFVTTAFGELGVLSPTGKIHAFSEDADGFVRSDGAGIVVLKRVKEAIADGDTVGESETERIRAVYTESMFYPDKTVIQLRNEQSGSDKGNGKPKRSWFRRGRR